MIVLSNSAAQTIQPGQAIVFDSVVARSCTTCNNNNRCNSCVNNRSSNFATIGCGTHSITFGGNVGSPTAATPVQLSIQVDGVTLPETTMISTVSTANVLNAISRSTVVKNCGNNTDRVTVVNTGTTPINVGANSALTIFKI